MKTFASFVVAMIMISWWPASLSNAKIPPEVTSPRPQAQPQPPKYETVERCTNMKVTAYYKVEKNQKRFSRKRNGEMRTYQEELRFQGEGIVTKSGFPPRIGTISANLERFPIGTILRIKQKNEDGQFETIFIGVVEDTGDDMIENPDQLDLFLGKGEKGLTRAENFGARQGLVVEVLKEVRT